MVEKKFRPKKPRILSWHEERMEAAKINLAEAKLIEKMNNKRHWIQKPDGSWIFAPKSLSKEEAIKKHEEALLISRERIDIKLEKTSSIT